MEASGKGKSLSRDEVNFSFAAVLQLELRQKKCRTQDVMDQAIGSDEISEQIFRAAIRRVSNPPNPGGKDRPSKKDRVAIDLERDKACLVWIRAGCGKVRAETLPVKGCSSQGGWYAPDERAIKRRKCRV